MAYIGKVPTAVPLTTSDLADGIVTVSKLATTLDLSSNTITLPSGVGGKVLQVVNANNNTADSTTSGSFVASSLLGSITPSSSSSKIFINITVSSNSESTSGVGGITQGAIYRQIASGGYSDVFSPFILTGIKQNGVMWNASGGAMQYLDSPNTTSQCDYKLYYKLYSGTSALLSNNSTYKTITLMEIA